MKQSLEQFIHYFSSDNGTKMDENKLKSDLGGKKSSSETEKTLKSHSQQSKTEELETRQSVKDEPSKKKPKNRRNR